MSAPETLDVDALPLPSELEPGGDADPDRPWAWRDHDADERSDDIERAREAHYEEPRPRFSGDPDDGPIDSPASFRAWERLAIVPRFLPSLDDAFGPPPKKIDRDTPCA